MNPILYALRGGVLDFRGRTRRSDFWITVLILYVIQIAISTIAQIFVGVSTIGLGESPDPEQAMNQLFTSGGFVFSMLLSSLGGIYVFLVQLSLMVRRFHDTGRSAWWLILPMVANAVLTLSAVLALITIFGAIGRMEYTDESGLATAVTVLGWSAAASFVVGLALAIWNFIIFIQDSAPDNEFGPNPKKAVSSQGMAKDVWNTTPTDVTPQAAEASLDRGPDVPVIPVQTANPVSVNAAEEPAREEPAREEHKPGES